MSSRLTAAAAATTAALACSGVAVATAGAHTRPVRQQTIQPTLSRPFLRWGDHTLYDRVPGAAFAANRTLTLNRGAHASSATFPGAQVRSIRLYAADRAGARSRLRVQLVVGAHRVTLGNLRAGSTLAPSAVLRVPASLQRTLARTDERMRVELTAVGGRGAWVVRGVYADPFQLCGGDGC